MASYSKEYLTRDIMAPEWWHTWDSCRFAQRFLLENFQVRLPRDTFRNEKARMRHLLAEYKHEDREAYRRDPDAVKAEKWASK